jgi:hypothetical protein
MTNRRATETFTLCTFLTLHPHSLGPTFSLPPVGYFCNRSGCGDARNFISFPATLSLLGLTELPLCTGLDALTTECSSGRQNILAYVCFTTGSGVQMVCVGSKLLFVCSELQLLTLDAGCNASYSKSITLLQRATSCTKAGG